MKKSTIDQAVHRQDLYGTHAEVTYSGVLSYLRRKYTRDLKGVDVAVAGIDEVRASMAELTWL